MQAVKALVSLCIWADSPEPSLLANAISTKISCAGPFYVVGEQLSTDQLDSTAQSEQHLCYPLPCRK